MKHSKCHHWALFHVILATSKQLQYGFFSHIENPESGGKNPIMISVYLSITHPENWERNISYPYAWKENHIKPASKCNMSSSLEPICWIVWNLPNHILNQYC